MTGRGDTSRATRRWWLAAITTASIATTVVSLAASPGIVQTLARWNDAEFARSTVGALNCSTTSAFSSQAASRLLSGTVFAGDVDSSTANRLSAVATGPSVAVSPSGSAAAGSGYRRDIAVATLAGDSTLSVPASVTLPTGTPIPAGWVSASGSGKAAAASGVLTSGGAPDATAIVGAPASWVTAHLDSIVSSATGSSLASLQPNVSSAKLLVGGMSSTVSLDACPALFRGSLGTSLSRGYAVAKLSVVTGSPLVSSMVSAAAAARAALVSSVAGIATNTSVINTINTRVQQQMSPLGILSLGPVSTTVSATLAASDLAPLDALLAGTSTGGSGLVTVDFAAGTITTDLAKLHQLAGRDPNTRLEYGSTESAAVSAALAEALAAWSTAVSSALDSAVGAVRITSTTTQDLTAVVAFVVVRVGYVEARIVSQPLASLRSGAVVANVTTTVLPAAGALSSVVSGLLTGLLGPLQSATSGVGVITANAVKTPLDASYSTLATTLPQTSTNVKTAIDALLRYFFASDGIFGLSINAQNAPQAGSNPVPAELAAIAAGRYDVAAVRLGVRSRNGVLPAYVGKHLLLARASAGPDVVIR